jgi:cytochrome oxidase Cu insertion factor (SCO1/SenC/PrrC family)
VTPGPSADHTAGDGGGAKRGLRTLMLMVAVFAAPVLAAWFLYFNPQYLPSGRSNLGELVTPVVPLPADLPLGTPAGDSLDRESLAGRWTLVYLAGADCADTCRARLRDLRQIRLALGEGSLSVERLLIITDPRGQALGEALARDFDGMRVGIGDGKGGDSLLASLGGAATALGRVYILDPLGNIMMRYASDAPAKDILNDMGRLIKASKNWIKGAGYGHK